MYSLFQYTFQNSFASYTKPNILKFKINSSSLSWSPGHWGASLKVACSNGFLKAWIAASCDFRYQFLWFFVTQKVELCTSLIPVLQIVGTAWSGERHRERGTREQTLHLPHLFRFFLSVCVFVIIFLKQFRCILGNCPPTPPLCQHFALSVNVGLGED